MVWNWVYCGSSYSVWCCVVIVTVKTHSVVKLVVLSCWVIAWIYLCCVLKPITMKLVVLSNSRLLGTLFSGMECSNKYP